MGRFADEIGDLYSATTEAGRRSRTARAASTAPGSPPNGPWAYPDVV